MGFFFALILVIIQFFLYDTNQKASRILLYFLLFTTIECGLDIATSVSIDGRLRFSDSVNLWLNSIFLIISIINAVLGYGLIEARLGYQKKLLGYIALFLLIVEVGGTIANTIWGFLFTFENGEYIKTPLFDLVYVFPFLFVILILGIYINKRKQLLEREGIASITFVLVVFIAYMMQMHFQYVLLTGFGKVLAAMSFIMLLETPEHMKLKKAVADLQKAQIDEKQALVELEEANEKKTEFLIHMSHELRTPINAIIGFNQLILEESENIELKKKARELQNSSEKLFDLVETIVDFSQIETGMLEMNPREYDFVEAYKNLEYRFKNVFKDKDISFSQIVSEDIPQRLYGDASRITQVIEKIVLYSINNMSSGNITLKVSVDHIEKNLVYMAFYLQNIGSTRPIDYDNNPLDFEVIEKILRGMNSELETSHKEGVGVIYKFILTQEIVDLKPLGNVYEAYEKRIQKDKRKSLVPHFVMPDARILVVDDTPVNLRVFEGLMKKFKVQVFSANSGREAVEMMLNQPFDLVYMDVLMPKMSGKDTLNCIRFTDEIISKDVPIIALTANVFLGAKDYYINEGFADYITKPIGIDSLANSLKKFLPDLLLEDWEQIELDEPAQEEPKELRYQDIPGLDLEVALSMCMEDMNLYTELVKEYCASQVDCRLSEALAKEDWDNYQIEIHGAKSASKTVGLMELFEAARKLEDAVKAEDYDYIHRNHMSWINRYLEAIGLLEEIINK